MLCYNVRQDRFLSNINMQRNNTMKKILSLVCICAMVISIGGCTIQVNPVVSTDTETPEASVTTTKTETTPAETTTVAAETEETTPAETAGSSDASLPADIADAINPEDTSDENPAAIGQWVKATRYATEDKTYHTIYVRVTGVTTETADSQKIQDAIDLNNSVCYEYAQIDRDEITLPYDVELCLLEYEVYVPEDFPSPEYGLVTPNVGFSQGNIGGGGIPSSDGASVYIGLGSNTESLETEEDPSYKPGNTYKFVCLFTMVQGYTNYTLSFSSYFEGTTEISSDTSYTVYYANN